MFTLEWQYLKYAKKWHPLQFFNFIMKKFGVDNLESNGNFYFRANTLKNYLRIIALRQQTFNLQQGSFEELIWNSELNSN